MRLPHLVRRPALGALLIALVTFAVHSRSLSHGFVVSWDDGPVLVDNDRFRGFDLERLRWMATNPEQGYQPLSWLSYAVDHALWGMEPLGYHLTNVLLHSLAAALAFLAFRRIVLLALPPDDERLATPLPNLAAAAAALLFSLHPLRVESVAWATERRDVLSGAFYVASILVWLRSREAAVGSARRRRTLVGALLLALGAMLAKGTCVVLPAVLLVLEIWPLRSFLGGLSQPRARRALLELLPFAGLSLVFGVVAVTSQREIGALTGWEAYSLGHRVQTVVRGLAFYPWNTLLPLRLAPVNELPAQWELDADLATSAALLVALCAAGWLSRKRWPAVPAALVAYALAVLPVSGLLPIGSHYAADRFSYLPCLSLALLAAAAIVAWPRVGTWAAVGVLPALAVATWAQTGIWRDDMTLWNETIARRPESPIVYANRGALLFDQGRLLEARADLLRVVRGRPFADALANLAAVEFQLGATEEAERLARAALEADPHLTAARRTRGSTLMHLGRPAEAAGEFEQLVQVRSDDWLAHVQLAGARLMAGDVQGAIEPARVAASLPGNDRAVTTASLADVLRQAGLYAEALPVAREAADLSPDSAALRVLLGDVLSALGQREQAAEAYRSALALEPGQPAALRGLELLGG